ncbi:hypothetical protein FB451DRAFT_1411850 [Mycena latifolia]|nr:hypothetical protein FB451DRAFT_1411850 [Mycena latifolia]
MSSSASLSHLNALAVLENPRVIPKSKTVVFDAQMYLGSSEPALIFSLRYFNADDLDFPDVSCCSVDVHPARTTSTTEVYSQELTPLDYHGFGDIVKIVPLGSPESFDLRHHAYIHACGLPSNMDKKNSTFDIGVAQFMSANKKTNNEFPVHCVVPATPRWENYKPIPAKGKPVAIEGFLTGIERNEDRTIKHFIVDLEKVTYLSPSSTTPKAEESPTKLAHTGTPARLKFTGFFGSQESSSDTKSAERPAKKRKTADDRALEESEDKGEGSSTGRRPRH